MIFAAAPVRLAPNGGSLCVSEAGTLPFLRMITIYPYILSTLLRDVKDFVKNFHIVLIFTKKYKNVKIY